MDGMVYFQETEAEEIFQVDESMGQKDFVFRDDPESDHVKSPSRLHSRSSPRSGSLSK